MLFPLYDRNPHRRIPVITILLIAANLYCFWRSIEPGAVGFAQTVITRGFIPARLTQMDSGKPLVVQQALPDGKQLRATLSTDAADVYPTLVTMMFLHGGLLHIASNLWMLWVFGDNVEDRLGRFVFVFFYLIGGLVAVLSQWAIDPESTTPVIGASGAVAAVLGAYIVTYPSAKVRTLIFLGFPLLLDLPSYLVLGAWFLLQTFAGVQGLAAPADVEVSVAFWAHIGGFVAGVLLMPLLTFGVAPPEDDWRDENRDLFDFGAPDRS